MVDFSLSALTKKVGRDEEEQLQRDKTSKQTQISIWVQDPLAVSVQEVSWETPRCHLVSSEVSVLLLFFRLLLLAASLA